MSIYMYNSLEALYPYVHYHQASGSITYEHVLHLCLASILLFKPLVSVEKNRSKCFIYCKVCEGNGFFLPCLHLECIIEM